MRFAKENIRCNVICPGSITTDMAAGLTPDTMDMKMMGAMSAHSDLSLKPCSPEDVARVTLFLASDDAKKLYANCTAAVLNTIVYQVKPSPSFTNDGIYYEVQEVKNKKLPITLSNKKNNEIEEEFNKYIIEAKVSEKQLPDFTQDYKYYKKSDVGRSLIVVAQDQLLYIVSYNL